MLSIKPGVKLVNLSPQMVLAAQMCTWCFIEESYNTTITSGSEGKHMRGSLHPTGNAIDLKTNHIPSKAIIVKIFKKIKTALGENYDAVFETDHIHVEYDPKG